VDLPHWKTVNRICPLDILGLLGKLGKLRKLFKVADAEDALEDVRKAGDAAAEIVPKTVRIDLGGEGFGNGAFVTVRGESAVIHVIGIDSADDLARIFSETRKLGATKGTLFTGPVTSPTDLTRYRTLAELGGSRFGGKVTRLGNDTFRLDFEDLPSFN
jgi:hypothetical protein